MKKNNNNWKHMSIVLHKHYLNKTKWQFIYVLHNVFGIINDIGMNNLYTTYTRYFFFFNIESYTVA